jgi:ribonuclease VapC
MVIDTSVVVAILLGEPELTAFTRLITHAPTVRLSAASYVEAAMVLEHRALSIPKRVLDEFVKEFGVQIEPVTEEHARLAADAFRKYGKGHHKAALNYGDCFTYALAKATREPLLFKGNDFSKTDLPPAVKPPQ